MRVARELHDGLGQVLSGVKFGLESLPGKIGGVPEEAEKEITKASGIIDRALAETRRVSQNLMPTELEDLGLHPALRGQENRKEGAEKAARPEKPEGSERIDKHENRRGAERSGRSRH